MKVSICLPVYEMKGKGSYFLNKALSSIAIQSHLPFEVVISDHSQSNELEKVILYWSQFLNIAYFRNENKIGSISANCNNCIQRSSGKILDFLFQSL